MKIEDIYMQLKRVVVATLMFSLASACIAGASQTQGVVGKMVTLGAWAPETGPVSALYATNEGADAFFRWKNAHGGINGYQFTMDLIDDQYNPALTPAAARRLVEVDKAFAIVAGGGTGPALSVLDYISSVGIPEIPAAGALELTHPVHKNIFTVVPSYVNEGGYQADYAVNQLKAKAIAVLYQNDDIGKQGLRGVTKGLAQHGLQPVVTVPFDLGTVNFAPFISRIMAAKADTVIFWGSTAPFVPAVKGAEQLGFRPKWITFGFDADQGVAGQLPMDQQENVVYSTWMPAPADPGMQDFRDALNQYYPQVKQGLLSVQGWCLASVFATAFAEASAHGATPTWPNVIKALESTKHVSTTYVHDLSFSPTNHEAAPAEYMLKWVAGKITRLTPYQPIPILDR